MKVKMLYLIIALFFIPLSPFWAQIDLTAKAGIEVQPSNGVVDISVAELQSIVEQLMQFKMKRRHQAALTYQQQMGTDQNTSSSNNFIRYETRIAEIERLLVQMNDRLALVSENTKQSVPGNAIEQQTSLAPATAIIKQDVSDEDLKKELAAMRKEIQMLYLNPPLAQPVITAKERDTIIQNNSKRYSQEQPKTETDFNSKAYLDAQFKEMRQLIGELGATKPQNSQIPVVATTPSTTDDHTLLKQQQAQIEALNRQVSELKTVIDQNSKNIVIKTPENKGQINDAVLMAQQNAQYEALRKQIDELKSNNAPIRETVVEIPTPKNDDNEELKAELAELRKMVAQIQPGFHTIKEKVITEAAPPDTSFNLLKRIIAGKEKRQLRYENNAFQVKDEHRITLLETIDLMKQHGELDLLIIGFTSEKGSPIYNKSLSQNRAENAKKHLMQQGIHPSRIFTEYHGIDYQATDPAQARRVDLMMMIRK